MQLWKIQSQDVTLERGISMLGPSYRNYLDFIQKKPESTVFSKITTVLLIVIFLVVGISAAAFYKFHEEAPLLAKYQYLESVNTDFSGAINSVNDILVSFKVAGDKIEVVDGLKESSASASAPGFYVSLDDVERMLSKIEATSQNLQSKKSSLEAQAIPDDLVDLANQVDSFYSKSSVILTDIYKDQLFAKQLLLASGPKFYLPTLTDDYLWQKQDKAEITNYYQSAKDEANTSLAALSKLSPSPKLQDYYKAQINYLTLLVKLSDDIINTLSISDDKNLDNATQIEKAYQHLTNAKKENLKNDQDLLMQKLKLVDVEDNLNKLTPLELQGNAIQVVLKNAYENTPQVEPAEYYIRKIVDKLPIHFSTLQLPTII